jgi:hypothetical protein
MQKLINFIDQINWHEVGQGLVKAIAFTYALGYCLGLTVHRTNAQLSAAHVAALGLKPTAAVLQLAPQQQQPTLAAVPQLAPQQQQPMAPAEIAQLSNRQLMQLVGTNRKISKKQLLAMYVAMYA